MQSDYQNLVSRLYKCGDEIAKIRNLPGYEDKKIDLQIMYKVAAGYATQVSKAEVDCRRLHHETVKFREAYQKFEEVLTNLEHYLTIAYLTRKD